MTRWRNTVRTGASRPALRGRVVLAGCIGLLLLASAGRALGTRSVRSAEATAGVQDTAHVSALLQRVRGVDATLCSLLGRALDNRWGSSWGWQVHDPSAGGSDPALLAWLDGGRVEAPLVLPLRRALSDGDACVRRTAARLLGRAQLIDLSRELSAELASSSETTREAALLALGHFDRLSASEAARAALRDQAISVRRAAAWALGRMEDEAAVPELSALLSDPDTGVRIQAAHALGAIESRDAIPALVRMLESDRDPRARRAAAAALGQISG